MSEEMQQTPVVESPKPEVPVAPERKFDAKDVEENKYVAALSYLWILFLVPLLMKKESPFAQFHAKQGLVLTILWIVGSFIFWFPVIGWALAIALLVVNVMALFRTLSGEAWEIPYVKDALKKLNI
jgi:uncharacterized membrane protein